MQLCLKVNKVNTCILYPVDNISLFLFVSCSDYFDIHPIKKPSCSFGFLSSLSLSLHCYLLSLGKGAQIPRPTHTHEVWLTRFESSKEISSVLCGASVCFIGRQYTCVLVIRLDPVTQHQSAGKLALPSKCNTFNSLNTSNTNTFPL